MALPIISNIWRVTFNWTGDGRHAANVLHFLSTNDAADTYDTLDSHVTSSMFDATRSTMVVDTVELLPLDGTSVSTIISTGRPSKWGGTQSSGDYQVAPAVLVNLHTATRGAKARGRTFLPFPADSAQAGGFVNSGNRTTIADAWTAFAIATSGDANSVVPVVASYRHAAAYAVTTYTVRSALATQRRRVQQLV